MKQDGYAEAFAAHYPGVLAFAARRVGDDDAEDVAAEVFTRAWSSWAKAPDDAIRPWLFGIARHVVVDRHRANGRDRRLELRLALQPEPARDDSHSFTDAKTDLARAWVRLTDSDREVLALVAWDGLTGAEAAKVLGCTRSAYSVRLTRARKRLSGLLDSSPGTAAGLASESNTMPADKMQVRGVGP